MMGSGMMGLNLVWVFVLLVGLIALVVWLVRVMFPQVSDNRDAYRNVLEDDALEVARQRYARGEISAEEFARLKQDLT